MTCFKGYHVLLYYDMYYCIMICLYDVSCDFDMTMIYAWIWILGFLLFGLILISNNFCWFCWHDFISRTRLFIIAKAQRLNISLKMQLKCNGNDISKQMVLDYESNFAGNHVCTKLSNFLKLSTLPCYTASVCDLA